MSAISGKTTVTTAGTAVALGTQQVNAALQVKALADNTGLIYLGNDGAGDVSSANGLELAAGETTIFDYVSTLAAIFIDSSVDGEGVSWMILEA